jgi:hypothetical protein
MEDLTIAFLIDDFPLLHTEITKKLLLLAIYGIQLAAWLTRIIIISKEKTQLIGYLALRLDY